MTTRPAKRRNNERSPLFKRGRTWGTASIDGVDTVIDVHTGINTGITKLGIGGEVNPFNDKIHRPDLQEPGAWNTDATDEPVEPWDCVRWPESPYCGGNPLTYKPIGIDTEVLVSGCQVCIRSTPIIAFLKMPSVTSCYTMEGCGPPAPGGGGSSSGEIGNPYIPEPSISQCPGSYPNHGWCLFEISVETTRVATYPGSLINNSGEYSVGGSFTSTDVYRYKNKRWFKNATSLKKDILPLSEPMPYSITDRYKGSVNGDFIYYICAVNSANYREGYENAPAPGDRAGVDTPGKKIILGNEYLFTRQRQYGVDFSQKRYVTSNIYSSYDFSTGERVTPTYSYPVNQYAVVQIYDTSPTYTPIDMIGEENFGSDGNSYGHITVTASVQMRKIFGGCTLEIDPEPEPPPPTTPSPSPPDYLPPRDIKDCEDCMSCGCDCTTIGFLLARHHAQTQRLITDQVKISEHNTIETLRTEFKNILNSELTKFSLELYNGIKALIETQEQKGYEELMDAIAALMLELLNDLRTGVYSDNVVLFQFAINTIGIAFAEQINQLQVNFKADIFALGQLQLNIFQQQLTANFTLAQQLYAGIASLINNINFEIDLSPFLTAIGDLIIAGLADLRALLYSDISTLAGFLLQAIANVNADSLNQLYGKLEQHFSLLGKLQLDSYVSLSTALVNNVGIILAGFSDISFNLANQMRIGIFDDIKTIIDTIQFSVELDSPIDISALNENIASLVKKIDSIFSDLTLEIDDSTNTLLEAIKICENQPLTPSIPDGTPPSACPDICPPIDYTQIDNTIQHHINNLENLITQKNDTLTNTIDSIFSGLTLEINDSTNTLVEAIKVCENQPLTPSIPDGIPPSACPDICPSIDYAQIDITIQRHINNLEILINQKNDGLTNTILSTSENLKVSTQDLMGLTKTGNITTSIILTLLEQLANLFIQTSNSDDSVDLEPIINRLEDIKTTLQQVCKMVDLTANEEIEIECKDEKKFLKYEGSGLAAIQSQLKSLVEIEKTILKEVCDKEEPYCYPVVQSDARIEFPIARQLNLTFGTKYPTQGGSLWHIQIPDPLDDLDWCTHFEPLQIRKGNVWGRQYWENSKHWTGATFESTEEALRFLDAIVALSKAVPVRQWDNELGREIPRISRGGNSDIKYNGVLRCVRAVVTVRGADDGKPETVYCYIPPQGGC